MVAVVLQRLPQIFLRVVNDIFSFLYAREMIHSHLLFCALYTVLLIYSRANCNVIPFLTKRPCSGLGDPVGAGSGASTSSRGTGRGSLLSTGGSAAGGKKDRIPNHWWELELTAEGPMLYPTSNCHEWTSDNGIEHRIMEIEFQHGCEVGEEEE